MKKFLAFATLFAALPLAAQPAGDQGGLTRQQGDEILKELRQIRQLLEKQQAKPARSPRKRRPPRPRSPTSAAFPCWAPRMRRSPSWNTRTTSARSASASTSPLFRELKKAYIDTGKVRFYSKDMPLDFHPNAMRAAMAARCAGEQGKFWELRDTMGANPNSLDIEHILNFAGNLKLDTGALRACIDSGKYKETVQNDVLEAMRIGANGTPTFIVGKSVGEGVDGELIVGALPFQMFDSKLKELQGTK